jgi:calcineurin-like phosphoesterase family protein
MEIKITLEKGQKLYFISDTHYGHTNICRGVTKWKNINGEPPISQTRPFQTLDEMNDRIVTGINQYVGENDILFHLGDFSFGGFDNIEIFRNRINCKNIHLILGNHDHHIGKNKNNCRVHFKTVNKSVTLIVKIPSSVRGVKDKTYVFELFHYPITSWENMNDGVIHLHGHVHLSPENRMSNNNKGRYMDVGVDGNGMDPIVMESVLDLVGNKEIGKLSIPEDHHEERLTV